MRKNTAGQVVSFQMNSATDGSAVTSGTPTVYVTLDGGTQSTGSGTSTHEGNGQWSYAPTQAETNGNHAAYTMAISGAISQTVNVYPVAYDPTDSALGLNNISAADVNAQCDTAISDAALATAAALATVDGNVDAILVDTGTTIPATLVTIGNYIDTEVAAIKAVTDLLPDAGALSSLATAAAVATIDANVDAILLDTGTDGVALSSATLDAIAAALLDLSNGVETGVTVRGALRVALSALAGLLSGADSNAPVFRDVNNTKNRITAVTDANGNRTSVTLDAT